MAISPTEPTAPPIRHARWRVPSGLPRNAYLLAIAVSVMAIAAVVIVLRLGSDWAQMAVTDVAETALDLLAAAAVLRAVRRVEVSRARRAWTVVAIAMLVYATGDGLWTLFDLFGGGASSPSLADVAYVAFYPIIVAALPIFPSVQSSRKETLRLAIDSAIIFIGGGIVVWHTIFGPALASLYPDPISAGLALGYPVGDLVLLFGVAATVLRRPTGVEGRALSALLLALVVMFAGDIGYGTVSGSTDPQRWPDLLFMASSLLIVLAGFLQANPAEAGDAAASAGLNRWLILLPYAGLAGGYGVLLLMTQGSANGEFGLVVYASMALTVLVLVRQELVLRDNSRLLAGHAQAESEARFSALTANTSDAVMLVDRTGVVAYASPSVERVLGIAAPRLVGRPVALVSHADDAAHLRELVADVGAGRPVQPLGWRLWDRAGVWRQVETVAANLLDDPRVGHIVLTTRDVGERKSLEGELAQISLHDRLTGMPNRALFHDRIERALASGGRAGRRTSIVIVGLDGFKRVNESLGLMAGDQVIQDIARRLHACARTADTCARLGGDEFAVLLDGDISSDEARAVAERALEIVRQPTTIGSSAIHLTASVGVATVESGALDATSLIRSADVARSVARADGRDRIVVFEPAMQAAVEGRFELEAELRRAIDGDELMLQYQPIVDMQTGALVGAEALVRWNHPTRGRLGPGVFIPLAEETGLIDRIGAWVLRTALVEVARWARISRGTVPRVSVNVAAHQLADPQLAWNVQAELARASATPSWLTLEVTESVFIEDAATVLEQMHAIHALGVSIALDDFGTGYSSLSYLQQFPVSHIKIDRSFVTPLDDPARSAGIAGAVVEIGRALGMKTVAEGIETPLQFRRLRDLGCTLGQGFLLSRPVDADVMAELVVRGSVPIPLGDGAPSPAPAVASNRPRRRRVLTTS